MKRFLLLAIAFCLVVAPLGAATVYQSQAPVTVDWTSATAQNATLVLAIADYSTVVVSMQPSSLAGGALAFEVCDEQTQTNWYPLAMVRSSASLIENTYTLTQSAQAWQGSVNGFKWFRVRLSTVIGGGTASLRIQASAAPLSSAASSYVDPSDGWALLHYYLQNRIRPLTTK